mmetsp:Transcript_2800/g.5166  ORF Transcript_2800/g.5166 Transcript_2800/m.5166 type:complete len:150 (-) Transcript_2800:623-1072(-)
MTSTVRHSATSKGESPGDSRGTNKVKFTASSSGNVVGSNLPPSPPRVVARIPHVEEEFEYNGDSPYVPMVAGSAAGAMEHIFMYPVDTVKTRMQASAQPGQPAYNGVLKTFSSIAHSEGIPRLYRGISPVLVTALPSHGVYFGMYETCD